MQLRNALIGGYVGFVVAAALAGGSIGERQAQRQIAKHERPYRQIFTDLEHRHVEFNQALARLRGAP